MEGIGAGTPHTRMVELIKQDPGAWSWDELVEVSFLSVLMGLAEEPNIMELEMSSLGEAGVRIFGKTPIPPRVYETLSKLIANE